MAGARARARARAQRKTQPLDLQEDPRREESTVTTLRIVPVGSSSTAARSGGTLQIPCTVLPVDEPRSAEPERARARPARPAARRLEGEHVMPRHGRARYADVPTAVIRTSRPNLAELHLRAAHALSGLQASLRSLQAQGIDLRRWSKSSIAWTAALGVYALLLFLIAILTS